MKKTIFVLILLLSFSWIYAQDNSAQKKINWLEGSWEGKGYQIDGQSWQVDFSHADKKFTISYPSLGCSGWWKITESGKGRIVFIENLTVKSICDQGDKVVVTKIDDKNISVAWFIPETFGDQVVGFSVLHKK